MYSPTTLITPFELQNLLGFPGSPTGSESGEVSANISPASSPTVKRGRGRPRKNPLPLPNPVEIPKVGNLIFSTILSQPRTFGTYGETR